MSVCVPRARAFGTALVDGEVGTKIARWERHNAESLIALDVRAPTSFDAVEVNLQLADAHLARVRGTPHAVRRSASAIDAHPADAVAVYVALRGVARFANDGDSHRVGPGQLLVCDADRPFARDFSMGLDELAIKIARDAITDVVGEHHVERPMVLDVGQHGRALAKLVARSLAGDNPIPADERAVLELVCALITGPKAALSLAHRVAARAYIDDHLADVDLSAADIAAAAGISERTLSRAFASADTSVPKQILARRLDAAYGVLSSTRCSVAEVAARCGFISSKYFSRSFHRRFGVRPSEIRQSN